MRQVFNVTHAPLLACHPGGSGTRVVADAVDFVQHVRDGLLESAPARAWPKYPARQGKWWLSSARKLIAHDSQHERDDLMLVDYWGLVTDAFRSPVTVLPALGVLEPAVAAWLVVVLGDGRPGLVFREDDACIAPRSLAGLDATIEVVLLPWSSGSEVEWLRWLAAYRHPRFRLTPTMEAVIRAQAGGGMPLAALVDETSRACDVAEHIVRANVYSQAWRRLVILGGSSSPAADHTAVSDGTRMTSR